MMDDLIDPALKPSQPLFSTLGTLREIISILVNQDDLDQLDDTNTYYDDLITLMDKLSASNANFSENIIPVLYKLISYLNKTYDTQTDDTGIAPIMNALNYMLTENTVDHADAQNLKNMLPDIFEALGKLMLRNNQYMGLDGTANQTGDPDNTYLGNAVEGIDMVLSGLNAISQDETARGYLTSILRDAGRMTSKNANGKLFKNVLLELMTNIEDYNTVGGKYYSSTDATVAARYHQNADSGGVGIYHDSELANGVKELWPALQLLFIRSRATGDTLPDYSILKDAEGRSPIEVIGKSLGMLQDAGIDFSTYTLEDSLRAMVEKDAVGETRHTNDVSFLDSLLFTLAVASNFGYKTCLSDDMEPYPNHDRGHGVSTNGIMTLNDSMYNLRSNDLWLLDPPVQLDSYKIALDERLSQGERVGRSAGTFTATDLEAGTYSFYLGYDYPALCLLPAACAGDAGIPNGGQKAVDPDSSTKVLIGDRYIHTTGVDGSNNDYRTYFPKVGNGIGELNTAAVIMGMIARVCWEGEGPYYSTAGATTKTYDMPVNHNQTVNVYYRPDGRIYAYVYKGGSTWEYFYPVDNSTAAGNDVADTAANNQRTNRYSEKLYTDYYLAKLEYEGEYCPPPVNENGLDYIVEDQTNAIDKYKLRSNASHGADRCVFWEKINETDTGRECATQEEAMFRNFQWLLNEKKFVFTIPMAVAVTGINAVVYVVIEANGLAGLGNAHKGCDPSDSADPEKGNGFWIKKGSEGLDIDHGLPMNYGDSYELGDARVMVFCREDPGVTVETVWGDVLGQGHVLPDVIAQNFSPMARMAFMTEGPELASGDRTATWDAAWTNRSKLLPLVAGAIGELHKRSYYEAPASSSDHNFNYAGANKYPIRTVLGGLIPPLAKPWMRHLEDTTNLSSSTSYWGKRLAPRIRYRTDGYEKTTESPMAYLTPAVEDPDIDLRPRWEIRTLTGMLTENAPLSGTAVDDPPKLGYVNGLIPILAQTNVVSNLMAMLQRIETNATEENKDKVFAGLEQVITSVKAGKGAAISREITGSESATSSGSYGDDAYCMVDYSSRQWLFGKRDVDISLDTLLEELIGIDDVFDTSADADFSATNSATWTPENWTLTTPGKGMAAFVDRRETSHVAHAFYAHEYPASAWNYDMYHEFMNGVRSLLADDSPNGDDYYVMDDVISLVVKLLSRVTATDDELKGLRHTLGTLLCRYEDTDGDPLGIRDAWVVDENLSNILTDYLPDIMNTFDGYYDDLLIVGYSLVKDQGLLDSILKKGSTHYSWSVLLTDFYNLLNDPFFVDPTARPSIWIGKNSLTELLVDMADLIGQDWYTRIIYYGPGYSKTDGGTVTDEYIDEYVFDPYTALGKILSPGGM